MSTVHAQVAHHVASCLFSREGDLINSHTLPTRQEVEDVVNCYHCDSPNHQHINPQTNFPLQYP